MARLKRYLTEHFDWTVREEEDSLGEAHERVEAAARRYLDTQALPATAMFDHLHEQLPAGVAAQRSELAARLPAGEWDRD